MGQDRLAGLPSEVRWQEKGITWRQTTRLPDSASTVLSVASGHAAHRLVVRVPAWASGARVRLNGRALPDRPAAGSRVTLDRAWRTGDRVEISLPMRTTLEATPDDPDVQAVLHGPVVPAGRTATRATGGWPGWTPPVCGRSRPTRCGSRRPPTGSRSRCCPSPASTTSTTTSTG
ncbi:hypothetical protein AB0L10_30945 [Streptomyces flaveolus]